MDALYNPLSELESFNSLSLYLTECLTPVLTTGVIESQRAHLLWALCRKLEKNACYIAATELDAKAAYEDLRFFYKHAAVLFPAKDIIFYNADAHSCDITRKRQEVIKALFDGRAKCVVISADALFDRLAPKDVFFRNVINIKTGDELNPQDFARQLVDLGYARAEVEVEGRGQFAMRGGIVDFCPPAEDYAYRVEFFADTIESVRRFDVSTQRSFAAEESVQIFPADELVCDNEALERAARLITPFYNKALSEFVRNGKTEEADNLKASIGEDLRCLSEKQSISNKERLAQFLYKEETNLLDYLVSDTLLFINEPSRVKARTQTLFEEFSQSAENRISKGYMLPEQMNTLLSLQTVLKKINRNRVVLFSTIAQTSGDFSYKQSVSFSVKATDMVKGNLKQLYEDLQYMLSQNQAVLFLSGSASKGEQFANDLTRDGIKACFIRDLTNYTLPKGAITVSKGTLRKGFSYQYIDLTVISDAEVFGERKARRRRVNENTSPLESFLDLNIGDYVVHRTHGIGVYRGMEKIVTDDISRDYMKITYACGGNLYVPVSGMDAVQKYIGGEGASPKLNRLGSNEFAKAKQRTKAAVKILAADLMGLYARRQASTGFVYSKDTVWQTMFEERFAYDETEDQLRSIEEVKADMESPKVMDRLLCGDVGYGKTEVALRAAFKAVQDSKQVAFLVPTTILAQQHYNTFTQRLKDFPVSIELLSRFRTKQQQMQSVERLKKGLSDIVIGTHRLLSKDIEFKDLGLIIVDEEQRFGVAHKEKLKRMRENVDVLTLTATPIPRTLHMSLTGLRDMSTLREPPLERHPVQTYVLEYNPEFIKDAIHRELARGGQVYFLHNRVRSIETMTARIKTLVPEANVACAHGQMYERDLESIMRDFLENTIDVLVCTTIIETGLDIANVNTIIVNDADRMGLSQLYQLRGRVGRSNRIAYAYLMYKKDKVLDEAAEKRLQTIREFTEFGSGFKIAMRDLEYRGAGSLLGAKQHGHMDSVGYELYCTMLKEAIAELQGHKPERTFETTIDLKVNAYIPDFYIRNESVKLEVYKKIAAIDNDGDYNDVLSELTDRFGKPPKSVFSLLNVAALKAYAHSIGVTSVAQKANSYVFTFENGEADLPGLIPLITETKGRLFYTAAKSPSLTYKPADNEQVTPLWLKGFLYRLANGK